MVPNSIPCEPAQKLRLCLAVNITATETQAAARSTKKRAADAELGRSYETSQTEKKTVATDEKIAMRVEKGEGERPKRYTRTKEAVQLVQVIPLSKHMYAYQKNKRPHSTTAQTVCTVKNSAPVNITSTGRRTSHQPTRQKTALGTR